MVEENGKDQEKLTEQQIAIAMAAINKQYKRGTIFLLGSDDAEEWPSISTGAPTLDKAIGIGGLPLGRIVEIFGPESCLAGDTELNVYRKKKNGKYSKIKNVTMRKLHDLWKEGAEKDSSRNDYYVESVDEYGLVNYNRVLAVHETGEQECFDISTEDGEHIIATKNHKLKSNGKWIKVEDLSQWDDISVASYKTKLKHYPHTGRTSLVSNRHPNAYDDSTYGRYDAFSVLESRLVYEATRLNHMSVFDYSLRIEEDNLEGLKFLNPTDYVLHADDDDANTSSENLLLLKDILLRDQQVPSNSNSVIHRLMKTYKAVDNQVPIREIKSVGARQTYDISVRGPLNNYIANDILVHNSGKTTLALSVIAEAHKDDGYCAFIDTEHALDPMYAKNLGVDLNKLLISQPDYGEQALDVMLQLVKSGNMKVVVLDSVAALVPKAELEGNMEAQQMGLQARLMSKAMRKLVSMANETNTLVIFVNQLREKIGVMFGNPEVTPGGRALKYNASVRIDIRRMKDIKSKEGDGPTGVHTKTKVIKNKMAPPFKIAEFDILYGQGVDKIGCVFDMAVEAGYLIKAGAWIKYGEGLEGKEPGAVMAQGRDDAVQTLKEDKELLALIKTKVNGE